MGENQNGRIVKKEMRPGVHCKIEMGGFILLNGLIQYERPYFFIQFIFRISLPTRNIFRQIYLQAFVNDGDYKHQVGAGELA